MSIIDGTTIFWKKNKNLNNKNKFKKEKHRMAINKKEKSVTVKGVPLSGKKQNRIIYLRK